MAALSPQACRAENPGIFGKVSLTTFFYGPANSVCDEDRR
jgi:hypothetical protein